MRVVVALGGNALLRRGERPDVTTQRGHVADAARAIADVAAAGHEVVVTHGNGPQVGLLAQQAAACAELPATPLDVLGAESDGMIGHLLEQALRSALPGREVATLLTQVRVDPADPAFGAPTKPIGLAGADGRRRLVASPEPLELLGLAAIRVLLDAGIVVTCAGGGGIPVVVADGQVRGVEAVVDKDLAAALLARELRADALLLLTDVDGVVAGWGTPQARAERALDVRAARALGLPAGSMGPKVEAACRVAEAGGLAAIGRLEDAVALLAGRAGTRISA